MMGLRLRPVPSSRWTDGGWCLAYNNPQVMSEGGGASYDDDGLMKLLMIGGGTGQVGRYMEVTACLPALGSLWGGIELDWIRIGSHSIETPHWMDVARIFVRRVFFQEGLSSDGFNIII